MSQTPIYDQMLWERANPIMIAPIGTGLHEEGWQEIGHLTPDSWETVAQIEPQKFTAHFKVTETSIEALTLFHGYDIGQLHETTREWLERKKPSIPRFKRAWVTESRRAPIPDNQIQDIAEQDTRVARATGASAKDIMIALQKLGAYETHRRILGNTQ